MCGGFTWVCVCTSHSCNPEQVRRGHWIFCDWNCWELWAAMWVLETEWESQGKNNQFHSCQFTYSAPRAKVFHLDEVKKLTFLSHICFKRFYHTYFLCMGVLSTCVPVIHDMQCPWKHVEGIKSSGSRFTFVCCRMDAAYWTWSSVREANALTSGAISPAPTVDSAFDV